MLLLATLPFLFMSAASRASISALKVCPACGPAVTEHVLPNALMLSASPLLQDLALDSLLALFDEHPVDAFGFADDVVFVIAFVRYCLSAMAFGSFELPFVASLCFVAVCFPITVA